MKNILLVGGITGGHAYPTAGFYYFLKSKLSEANFYWYGFNENIEFELAKKLNINFLSANYKLKSNKFLLLSEIANLTKEFNFDLIFVAGAYISVVAVIVAKLKKAKIIGYNPDPDLGLALKLAKFLNVPITSPFKINGCLKIHDLSIEYFKTLPKRTDINFKDKILIVGGSKGALSLNNTAFKLAKEFKNENFILITGKKYYENFKNNNLDNLEVYPYVEGLPLYFEDLKLIISRSGAGTVYNVIKSKLPAIFIPFPKARLNHQLSNAKMHKASLIVEESNLLLDNLIQSLRKILDNYNYYKELANISFEENELVLEEEGAEKLWNLIMSI